jgi:glycosyltransferase involved in cell wall biosynthesis
VPQDSYSLFLIAGNQGHLKDSFLELPGVNVTLIPQLIRNIHPLYDIIILVKLFLHCKKYKFDIIHTHSPKASFLARWAAYCAGIKNIIYTVHGWPFHKFMNPASYLLYLLLEKLTARITKKIIVVSSSDLKIGRQKKIAHPEKLKLIHYGIDVTYFNQLYLERRTNPPTNPLIITVSSFKKQKGLHLFLDMAHEVTKQYPLAMFYIIGDGPLKAKMQKIIKNFRLEHNVVIKGWIDDLSPFYTRASLFVLTSLWEGLPVALIEAVTCGIPVLVTDTGGIQDIVTPDKQGKIVALNTLSKIAPLCKEMLRDYPKWSTITNRSREMLQLDTWSEEAMTQKIQKIYDTII